MRAVWAADHPLTVRKISESLQGETDLAYTTVQTVTERLVGKGWLSRQRQGKAFVYQAARSAEEYTAGLMEEALDDSVDRPGALVQFAGQLTESEAAMLRSALDHADWPSDPK
ncbi:MAG: BlaI/MecI/CopY family transcriptional regulator [Actinobacteria bacterium]|nr:BlaI/MecI/CopY family transcriptional regulator [Actinomycetota bacterium]